MREHRQKVKKMMQHPLPSITEQKRKTFRPTPQQTIKAYNLLNEAIFDGKLSRPPIEIKRLRLTWGICHGDYLDNLMPVCKKIVLSDKFYTKQWFLTTLAHEMSHQWQWEIQGVKRFNQGLEPNMNHRASFFVHKKRMATMDIPLKSWHRMRKWFKYQDLFKC